MLFEKKYKFSQLISSCLLNSGNIQLKKGNLVKELMFKTRNKVQLSPRLKLGVKHGYTKNQILKFCGAVFFIFAFVLAVNAVRLAFNGKNIEQTAKPKVLGETNIVESKPRSSEFKDIEVQKGDTLFNLSKKYNINWTTLATINNLKSPFNLKPGQILKVPSNW